jgi:hypothetical protein
MTVAAQRQDEEKSAEYDATEARELLARASGELNRNRMAAEAAASRCLAEFVRLVDSFDHSNEVFYTRPRGSSAMEFGRVHTDCWVSIAPRDYGFAFRTPAGDSEVRISYNAGSEVLEGSTDESFIVPVPGQPVRRRTGLAILTQAAITAVMPDRPDVVALWEKQ